LFIKFPAKSLQKAHIVEFYAHRDPKDHSQEDSETFNQLPVGARTVVGTLIHVESASGAETTGQRAVKVVDFTDFICVIFDHLLLNLL
jgi:hypothetical protein